MKFIKILLLSLLLYSCDGNNRKPKPIELYQNHGYVVIEEPFNRHDTYDYSLLRLKCKDSVFIVIVPFFDGGNLKIGDTLKSK